MFTYIEFYKLTPEWREKLPHTPEYLDRIRVIIEEEGGKLEKTWAFMGPWDFVSFVRYPDNETAFRVLARIGLLGFVQTETYPAEEVEVFTKVFV